MFLLETYPLNSPFNDTEYTGLYAARTTATIVRVLINTVRTTFPKTPQARFVLLETLTKISSPLIYAVYKPLVFYYTEMSIASFFTKNPQNAETLVLLKFHIPLKIRLFSQHPYVNKYL